MFGFGIGELLVVLVIVLVLFSNRLPDLGEGIGKSIRKFRKAVNQADEVDITPKKKKIQTNRPNIGPIKLRRRRARLPS
jgi:sec-independent protein translocase protein TatA